MSTRAGLRTRIRSFLQRWPDTDVLQASITSAVSTLTIADGTRAPSGSVLEIEDETLGVRLVAGNVLTVRRADRGTTAAAHNSPASVLIHGQHDPSNREINEHVSQGIEWLFPVCALEIVDYTTETKASTVAYSVPPRIEELVELYLEDSFTPHGWSLVNAWQHVGSWVYLSKSLPAARTLAFRGWGRFTQPADDDDLLDVGTDLEEAVVLHALSRLVKSREILRGQFTGQSALLEARAGNIPDLIGSSRDLMAGARVIRAENQTIRPYRLRRIVR